MNHVWLFGHKKDRSVNSRQLTTMHLFTELEKPTTDFITSNDAASALCIVPKRPSRHGCT